MLEWVRAVVLQRRFAAPIPPTSEISVGFQIPCRTLILLIIGRSGKIHTGSIVDNVGKNSPVTGLEWPREFQEFKVPRFHDNGTGWW